MTDTVTVRADGSRAHACGCIDVPNTRPYTGGAHRPFLICATHRRDLGFY